MNLCDKESCTGCASCVNACPTGAIAFVSDDEGFLRPLISSNKCSKCGKCVKSCPQITPPEIPVARKGVFACWHKDGSTRSESSSGGAFTALAEEVLRRGGRVYGAAFNGFPKVAHVGIDKGSELKRLRGSKYLQSEIGKTFIDVKADILSGKKVLFSGTPCQVAGLYACLGERYGNNLITVDLVCHGVPSPKVFADYVKWVENNYGASVQDYKFRYKKFGWYLYSTKIALSNGKSILEHFFKNPFSQGFLREYFLRPSCHHCLYAGLQRPADITLSDFWGYRGKRKDGLDKDDDKGVSMVMLNTAAGAQLFDSVKENLVVWERSVDDAIRGNHALRGPFQASPLRVQFWFDYRHLSFGEVVKKYMYPEELAGWWLERYTLLGKLRSFARRVLGRFKCVVKKVLGARLTFLVKVLWRKMVG